MVGAISSLDVKELDAAFAGNLKAAGFHQKSRISHSVNDNSTTALTYKTARKNSISSITGNPGQDSTVNLIYEE